MAEWAFGKRWYVSARFIAVVLDKNMAQLTVRRNPVKLELVVLRTLVRIDLEMLLTERLGTMLTFKR